MSPKRFGSACSKLSIVTCPRDAGNVADSRYFRVLAKAIDENKMFTIPKPMSQARLEEILLEYGLIEAVDDYAILCLLYNSCFSQKIP